MRNFLSLIFFLCSILLANLHAQAPSSEVHRAPLRVGILGLVHGPVDGFFHASLHSPDIQIVGIAEPNQQLFLRYANQYGLDRNLLFPTLEEMRPKGPP